MIETLVIKIETLFVITIALHALLLLSHIPSTAVGEALISDGMQFGNALTSSPITIIQHSTEAWNLKNFKIEVVKYDNNTHHLQLINKYSDSQAKMRRDISIKVRYRLLYHDLTKLNPDTFCKDFAPYLREGDLEAYCRADLYSGRPLNVNELEICRTCSTDVNMNYADKLDVVLDCRLLPFQSYEFNITTTIDGHIAEDYMHYHCTDNDIPVAPPMAYVSSFDVERSNLQTTKLINSTSQIIQISNLTNKIVDSEEIINIYWRPIPHIYAGAKNFNYTVRCKHYIKNDDTDGSIKFDTTKTKVTLRKFAHYDAECLVYTQNHVGISKNLTQIFIPKKSNRPEVGRKFRFLVTEVKSNHYRIRWAPFKLDSVSSRQIEYLPMNTPAKNLPGLIQIYWCVKQASGNCDRLDGMVKLRNLTSSSYDLVLPAYSSLDNRQFGLAYLQQEGGIKCTGIAWSQCATKDEKLLSLHVMRIDGFISRADSDEKMLTVSWTIPECDLIIFDINTYEFNYCGVEHHELCSTVWGSLAPVEPTKFPFSEQDQTCSTKITENQLNTNATLIKADPKVHYYVRVRYVLANGTVSEWSNSLYIPAQANCRVGWSLILMIMLGIMLATVIYRRWARWFSYSKSILYRFNNTRANVGDIVDMDYKSDAELMAQKYCINKETIDQSGGLCDNVLEYIGGLTSNDDEDNQYKGDYIKRNLIEGNSRDTTPENSSESLRGAGKDDESFGHDELSISSDSSFLNNILDGTPNASLRLDSNS